MGTISKTIKNLVRKSRIVIYLATIIAVFTAATFGPAMCEEHRIWSILVNFLSKDRASSDKNRHAQDKIVPENPANRPAITNNKQEPFVNIILDFFNPFWDQDVY